jgi:hypothetical protein
MEEQTILMLIQIDKSNGTLQPTHDSGKSDGVDGAVDVVDSRLPGLLVFLVVVLLLLECLIPQERDKPYIQGFIVAEIPTSLVL